MQGKDYIASIPLGVSSSVIGSVTNKGLVRNLFLPDPRKNLTVYPSEDPFLFSVYQYYSYLCEKNAIDGSRTKGSVVSSNVRLVNSMLKCSIECIIYGEKSLITEEFEYLLDMDGRNW